jgi:putative ABC transport system permease protein
MGIILKFTMRNIKEHKFRTFLIILSISLSVMLFFASFSISDALTSMFMDNIRTYIGTSEVIVSSGPTSESGLVTIKDLGDLKDTFEYQIGSVEYSAKYQKSDKSKVNVSLKGFTLDDLQTMNPVNLIEPGTVEEKFTGKTAIIGESFATENNLKVGDSMRMIFSEDDIKLFRVGAIAENKGYFKKSFMSEGGNVNMIIPLKSAQNFAQTKSAYHAIYLKTADQLKIDANIESLKTVYRSETVDKTITKAELDAQIRPIRVPFLFMLILVVIISIFIIYTSFKVIMLERLPVLGTFRSIGATKKMTNSIMIIECFLYGTVGSLIGTILGTFALSGVMTLMMTTIGGTATLNYPKINLLYAFLFGVTLSTISAIIPIIKTTKIPVKEVLLNIIEGTKKKRPYIRYIVGGIFGVGAVALPIVVSEGMMAAAAGGLSVVCAIVAVICFIPVLTDMLLKATEKLFGVVFGNIGMIASKNLKGNKSTYDNVILLAIGLSSIVTISVLGDSMEKSTLAYFDAMQYDVSAELYGATQTSIQRILTVEGIEDVLRYEETYGGYKINGEEKSFVSKVLGADKISFFEYINIDVLNSEDDTEIYKQLLAGKHMILSTKVKEKYNLELNQVVKLKTNAGNKEYKIIGFFNDKKSAGTEMITSSRNVRYDTKNGGGINLAIKLQPGVNKQSVVDAIEKKVNKLNWYRVELLEKQKAEYLKENQMLVTILSAFSAATALIGSIGVMNNFLVSFLSRRKSFAILTSVGMSKKQRTRLILIEAAAAGFVGSVFGLGTGFLIIQMVGGLLKKIEVDLILMLTPAIAVSGMVGAILVCLMASVSVAKKSAKLSILEELKYE